MYQTKYRANGSFPDSAEVDNNTLFFRGPVTYSFSGTYICEARNAIGSQTGQVDVNVTGKKEIREVFLLITLDYICFSHWQ